MACPRCEQLVRRWEDRVGNHAGTWHLLNRSNADQTRPGRRQVGETGLRRKRMGWRLALPRPPGMKAHLSAFVRCFILSGGGIKLLVFNLKNIKQQMCFCSIIPSPPRVYILIVKIWLCFWGYKRRVGDLLSKLWNPTRFNVWCKSQMYSDEFENSAASWIKVVGYPGGY